MLASSDPNEVPSLAWNEIANLYLANLSDDFPTYADLRAQVGCSPRLVYQGILEKRYPINWTPQKATANRTKLKKIFNAYDIDYEFNDVTSLPGGGNPTPPI